AFTAYGTQLFWPFMPTPSSWSSLFIIDPFFTLPLVIAFVVGLTAGYGPKTYRLVAGALACSVLYLGLSVAAKHTVESRVLRAVEQKGLQPVATFSTPEPFSILLWRVVVRTADDHYVEAISGLLDTAPPEYITL